ncbi:unnamed protein product [Eruca vesicaria subsp. sativa]|uniref:Uncharacterized protein n=1 Tax=Eruca vesicaria subsp. sativa TaxID=29727 RepID=A0ABC8L0L7_ERUVS|nr:unnamed protein product [Eruca vesicaria subsp. sativa]
MVAYPPHHQILSTLLQDLQREKACREHGFYLAFAALKRIDNTATIIKDRSLHTRSPSLATHSCLQKEISCKGLSSKFCGTEFSSDQLHSLTYTSRPQKCQVTSISRQSRRMRSRFFRKEDLTKIAAEVVVRFKVETVQFKEKPKKNEFYTLTTMEDDDTFGLGPISLIGPDAPYM